MRLLANVRLLVVALVLLSATVAAGPAPARADVQPPFPVIHAYYRLPLDQLIVNGYGFSPSSCPPCATPSFVAEVFVRNLLTGMLLEHDFVLTSQLGTIYDATHYFCRLPAISVQARDDHTGRWSNIVILRACPV